MQLHRNSIRKDQIDKHITKRRAININKANIMLYSLKSQIPREILLNYEFFSNFCTENIKIFNNLFENF